MVMAELFFAIVMVISSDLPPSSTLTENVPAFLAFSVTISPFAIVLSSSLTLLDVYSTYREPLVIVHFAFSALL